MGNKNSSMLQDEEIHLISEETGFSPAQIERLYERFKSLDKSGICGSLSRQDFLRVPELAINPLCDRIVHMFFVDCDEDHDRINFRQFMKVLATFRSSAKPTRSRQASRQESIQNILTSLSQNKFRHSRHSSCDGFFNYYPVQHHTTNQHSIHYVASTTHLAQHPFLSYNNNIVNNQAINNSVNHQNASTIGPGGNVVGLFKKPYAASNHNQYNVKSSLLDPDEPANSRKQKLYFMFKIYDVDNDDRISLDDLKQILTTMVGKYISNSKLTELAIKTLKQADRNGDGFIDFDEFCTAFLHRDIDELLRVKFATSSNSGASSPTSSNNINNNNNNNNKETNVGGINNNELNNSKGTLPASTLAPTLPTATSAAMTLTRAVRENILNKSILR
uniref:Calcium-binding protein p22 n=1 Tax=Aceria tosichella TaxID=561515 RepID=A0A6G1SH45_9ACAR